ncbi:MAG: hypothetical protein IKE30_05645 [Clostridia bacterium]|nr:hypothetical protein [Clostridia bacterium]
MVSKCSTGKKLACAAIAVLLILAAGCGAEGNSPRQNGKSGKGQFDGAPDNARKWIIHGPQVPPDGMAYDQWKGIRYSGETKFDVKLGWYPYGGADKAPFTDAELEERGYQRIEDMPSSVFEIVSAEEEPVGGEMKLRSGGYVDVRIVTRTTAEFRYSYRRSEETEQYLLGFLVDRIRGIIFADVDLYPFDLYTGVSLLNTVSADEDQHISVGEATDSGFVESRVTRNGRTFRLLARADERNASFSGVTREEADGVITVTFPSCVETIYTFRVPADYDGLAVGFPKSVRCDIPSSEDQESTGPKEVYVDILTDSGGGEIDPENCWFLRVSDLVDSLGSLG